jgi:hypothetical protein
MRAFWTLFFLGSMLLIGLDVVERRQAVRAAAPTAVANDPGGYPTPRP